MILFSGGVDSVLIAALAHRCLPVTQLLDLCNVCFDEGRSPDRLAAHAAVKELAAWGPERSWRLIEVDATLEDTYLHK
jgi:asparagine synthetase B (glutamine-hydrolysing)